MSSFELHLQSSIQYEFIQGVRSFVAEDETGSFGILPSHARFMTALRFGLARFQCQGKDWQYLAIPGGVIYFIDNKLYLNTRNYVRCSDYLTISNILREQILSEEEKLKELKNTLHHMDQEMLKKMWELRRSRGVSF